MARYFYTDPLAAAWMAKHFGMKITCGLPDYPMHYDNADDLLLRLVEVDTSNYGLSQSTRFDWYGDRFHIHPDSLHLLEPKVGDVLYSRIGGGVSIEEMLSEERASQTGPHIVQRGGKIIQRNGLPFMWPESEPV